MNKSEKPRLVDLIIAWMKKELPKAGFEETNHQTTFTINKRVGKIVRECFKVEFRHHEAVGPSFGTIFSTTTKSNLFEEFTIPDDRVVFGKWNSGAEVLAADPQFFQKLTLYMTRAAMVVTMGDFAPNIPSEVADVAV